MTGPTEQVRLDIRKSLRRDAYFYAVMVLTVVLAAGSSILVTVVLTHRSERKLCAVVINADEGYQRVPPQTRPGQEQARNIHALRERLGCTSEGEQQ